MICWERVNELRDEVGAEDFLEVVEIFLEEVEEVIVRLRNAPNPADLEADLHFLKGSALNLGFQTLGNLCGDGEKDARNNDTGNVDLATVIDIYERSKREFLDGDQKNRFAA
jgi:histidine phosphotransfer protein HptB